MKNKPAVSFIIVNYNGEKFLPKLINSIQNQSSKSFEILLVDNNSSDNSVKLVCSKYPSVKVIKSSNIGYGRGCNLGAKHSRGEYLVFLNPDIYLDENYLKNILQVYQQKTLQYSETIGCLNCKISDYTSNHVSDSITDGSIIDIFGNPRQPSPTKSNDDSFHVMGTGLFIRKKIFNNIGRFNPNFFLYGEEVDLCWRLKTQGYRNIFTNDTVIYHYGGASFGNNRPYQVALMVYGAFLGAFTNYQSITLLLLFPLYFFYIILLSIALCIKNKLNLNYFFELIKQFRIFFRNLKKIIKFRNFVQNNRTKSDLKLFRDISFIPTVFTRISQ